MSELRISLDYNDFARLVDGQIIDRKIKPGIPLPFGESFRVKIALQDIGFDTMQTLLSCARFKAEKK